MLYATLKWTGVGLSKQAMTVLSNYTQCKVYSVNVKLPCACHKSIWENRIICSRIQVHSLNALILIATSSNATKQLIPISLSLWTPSQHKSLMKQQTVVTHRYTILQGTKKTWPILNRPALKHVIPLWKCKEKQILWTQHLDRWCVCNPTV
jgi:hypothetical protein